MIGYMDMMEMKVRFIPFHALFSIEPLVKCNISTDLQSQLGHSDW